MSKTTYKTPKGTMYKTYVCIGRDKHGIRQHFAKVAFYRTGTAVYCHLKIKLVIAKEKYASTIASTNAGGGVTIRERIALQLALADSQIAYNKVDHTMSVERMLRHIGNYIGYVQGVECYAVTELK